MSDALAELKAAFKDLADGRCETPQFESLLIDAWSSIAGSEETKLAARKLMRLEGLEKRDGKLYFDIERHGGTVHGSTRGEVYTWEVDVEHATATIIKKTHRQLYKADKRLDVGPMAKELADCIIGKQPHPHLQWNESKSSCKLLIGKVIPKTNKQTTAGRRDRLRYALNALLLPQGLEVTNRNVVQIVQK
jgi:hypothetical protein